MTETLNYAEMSVEDLRSRASELRHDFAEKTRAEQRDEEGARAILQEVNDLDLHLTVALHQIEREFERSAGPGPLAGTGDFGGGDEGFRSIGDFIVNDPTMQSWVENGMRAAEGGRESFQFSLPTGIEGLRVVSEFGAGGPGNNAVGGINSLLPVGQPIAPLPRQARLFMRDLIPVQKTTLAVVPYVRELTPTASESGASAVSEGNVKPDVSLNFQPATAYVTVIAANLSPTKQLWEDAPLVVAYINQRLPYLVKFKEDAEFLNGDGTFPNVDGLAHIAGHQTQGAVNTDDAQTLGMAIAKIENVDGDATAVVMNPTDAWSMFTKRAAGGSGTFDAGTVFSLGQPRVLTVWGLPTLRSRAYAAGSALVGDYQRGAMILDRQETNVQVYPQHSDYAARNQILVQCEERVGLLVPRPDLFVVATMS